jgi:hypothetical protein
MGGKKKKINFRNFFLIASANNNFEKKFGGRLKRGKELLINNFFELLHFASSRGFN